MKRVILSTLFTIAVLGTYAQSELRLKVGLVSSNLTEDLDDFSFESQNGFEVGADLLLGSQFYIQPGVSFELVRNEIDPIDPDADIDTDFNVSRIRIPVMVGYRLFDPEEDINIRLFAGPEASFVINRDFDSNLSLTDDDFNDVLWAGHVGAGLDILIFFIDIGYTFGLSDVFEDVEDSPRNNLFHGNVGVRLRF